MAENESTLTEYALLFFDRATGEPIKDDRYENCDHASDRPPAAPTGDEVAILHIQGVKGKGIFWGFDGKWHKNQPEHWDLIDRIEESGITGADNVLSWPG